MTTAEKLCGLVREQGDLDVGSLTIRQLAVLLAVAEESGQMGVRELAIKLHVHKPTITRASDKLCGLGLMQRKQDGNDLRLVRLVIQPLGREAARRMTAAIEGTRP
jgi:DNA-binding MarR family transcriptional regulator